MRRSLLALVAACCAAAPAASWAARSDWREVQVGRFHIYSTLRDSRTREIARQLQVFEKTAGGFVQGPDALPDVPTLVYLLDGTDFNRYAAGRPGLGGFFAERRYANVMVINSDMDFEYAKASVLHEFTHYIQRTTEQVTFPPWYAEGLAELVSSFKLKGRAVTLGQAPAGLRIYLDDWIPIERVLAVKASDPEYHSERLMPQFYGEAWGLVHYLLFDNRELRVAARQYLRGMDVGLPEPEAFERSFPFDKKVLDASVMRLLQGGGMHIMQLTYGEPITADEVPINHLTVAQADAAFVRLLLLVNPEQKDLAELTAQALKENAADPAMRALASRVAARRHEPADVADQVSSLPQDAIGTASVRIDLADALLSRGGVSDDDLRKVEAMLRPVVDGDAPPVEAVALWAMATARLRGDPARMIAVLEPASKRSPHDTQLLGFLAAASTALGKLEDARQYYHRIILVSHFPEERLWAQKQADSPRLQEPQPGAR